MKRDKAKEVAKSLYINGVQTQREISLNLGIPLTTINRWSKKDKWSELRASMIVSKEDSLKRIYSQINELTDAIQKRENKYPTASEADTLNKLATAVNRLEKEDISDVALYHALVKYTNWLAGITETKEDEFFLSEVLASTKQYLSEIVLDI